MTRDYSRINLGLIAEAARELPNGTPQERTAYILRRRAEIDDGGSLPLPYQPEDFTARSPRLPAPKKPLPYAEVAGTLPASSDHD